jgi:hypothetical protein
VEHVAQFRRRAGIVEELPELRRVELVDCGNPGHERARSSDPIGEHDARGRNVDASSMEVRAAA